MNADVCDILGLSNKNTDNKNKSTKKSYQPKLKRPSNVKREVWELLPSPTKLNSVTGENSDVFVDAAEKKYCAEKAQLGFCHKVRHWIWKEINIIGRNDLTFYKWVREDMDETHSQVQCAKELSLPKFSDDQLDEYIRETPSAWSKQDILYLLESCRTFNIKFMAIADRWDDNNHGVRSVVDIKDQYYALCAYNKKLPTGTFTGQSQYDADNEKKRKLQLDQLLARTNEEVVEERMLLKEIRRIEERRRGQTSRAVQLISLLRLRKHPFSIELLDEIIKHDMDDSLSELNKEKCTSGPIFASQQMKLINSTGPRRMQILQESLRREGLVNLSDKNFSHKIFCRLSALIADISVLCTLRVKSLEFEEDMCVLMRSIASAEAISDKINLVDPCPTSLISYKLESPTKTHTSSHAPVCIN
ncbi:hypothetical protein GJ496_006995 [Pomphorhynchus laevis]|nr:hypothetical protein GJ496_006995 [Pomphorhynchus laevis]